jgi:hypothetical protein
MLTPILLLMILMLLLRFLQGALERFNAALITLALLAAVAGGTYWAFEESPPHYFSFLAQNGVETDAEVIAISHGDSFLLGGPYAEVEITYQNSQGTPIKANYISMSRRFFPRLQEPITPPDVGDHLRILYFPNVESGFLILTDAKKSTYGAKLECNEAQLVLHKAEFRYRNIDFPTPADRESVRNAIDALLPLDCIDLTERDRIRELNEKLKP